ncbi:hypothetical protein IFO68_12480 [Photobacterium sp. CAU 1568]|uniref:Putative Flp pilus-assembly TadG-like N-terminal domain-containing protein n=1 Tax=Photobacterium arenosum TaxID=2774143 RepID=A0ABR9BMP5_9GAMM|nr:pilus assembly protein TadG-related protein [Photobacterium arenosum]MBD8513488.1 hypothetical protein [Photobacterium arenosum]
MLSPSRSPGRFSRISRQRGAVGVGLILLMVSMVLFLAMAVDTGRLYMEKRKLQKQADLAALSLGRSACYIDGINNKDTLETLVKQNLAANGFDTTASNPTIEFGAAQIAGNEWEFEPASTTVKSAGRVTISKTVPGSLISQLYNPNDVTLSASAAVYKQVSVEFGVGSSAVNVGLTNSVLGAALKGNLNIISYDALVNGKISLAALLIELLPNLKDSDGSSLLFTDLTVGDVDDILDAYVNVADIIEASILVLGETTDEGAVLSTINQLALNSGLPRIQLSEILSLGIHAHDEMVKSAALASKINLFDLVSGTIYAANKDNFISIPNLDVDLGVAGLAVALKVIEPPQFEFGKLPATLNDDFVASAKTSQVDLKVKATLLNGGLDLGLIALEVGTIGVHATIAQAETRLLDVYGCSLSGNGMKMDFSTKPSVATIRIGDGGAVGDKDDFGSQGAPIKIGAKVGLKTLSVETAISVPVSSSTFVNHIGTIDKELEMPQKVSTVNPGAGNTLQGALDSIKNGSRDCDDPKHVICVDVKGLGILDPLLGSVLDALLTGLIPVVIDLIDDVLVIVLDTILTNVLGIQVGTADVFVKSIDVDGGGLIE